MSTNKYVNRITILRKMSYEEDGFLKDGWKPIKRVWASANKLFGKEYWSAKEYGAEDTVIFTIRFNACKDLNVKDKILFNDRTFNIIDVDNVMFRNEELKIKAKELIK